MTHFDPLTALTDRNPFVGSLTPFLRRLVKLH
jgi:hypothetical protein